jgi:hypothetical protein
MSDSEKQFVPLEEYFNTDFDFGFTAVDDDSVESEEQVQSSVVSSDEIIENMEKINSRINSIFMLLDSDDDNISNDLDFSRIEEKIDKILNIETNEFSQAMQNNSDNIKVIIDEIEERKHELEQNTKERMISIEEMILPLLYNLMKSSDKNYIYWPDREIKLKKQIEKIISVTRKDT